MPCIYFMQIQIFWFFFITQQFVSCEYFYNWSRYSDLWGKIFKTYRFASFCLALLQLWLCYNQYKNIVIVLHIVFFSKTFWCVTWVGWRIFEWKWLLFWLWCCCSWIWCCCFCLLNFGRGLDCCWSQRFLMSVMRGWRNVFSCDLDNVL